MLANMKQDAAAYDGRIKFYRFVAYSTASSTVVALVSVGFALSMLQSYASFVVRNLDKELSFCQVRVVDRLVHLTAVFLCGSHYAQAK